MRKEFEKFGFIVNNVLFDGEFNVRVINVEKLIFEWVRLFLFFVCVCFIILLLRVRIVEVSIWVFFIVLNCLKKKVLKLGFMFGVLKFCMLFLFNFLLLL